MIPDAKRRRATIRLMKARHAAERAAWRVKSAKAELKLRERELTLAEREVDESFA